MKSIEVVTDSMADSVSPTEPEEGSENKPETFSISPEELEKYREAGQKMLDSYQRFFMTFARDVSLRFKLSNAFFIDYEKGEIHLDTKWFAKKGFTEEQILWATLHELSHFRDLSEDPKGILGKFEYLRHKAKELAPFIVEKYRQSGVVDEETLAKMQQRPKQRRPDREELTPIEEVTYEFRRAFYNQLDDIYVNNIVSRKAPRFEKKRKGGKEIRRLYKEKLFEKNDYTKLPRHMQFGYYLLRREMIPDQEIKVGPDVEEVLKREIMFDVKPHTVQQIIEQFIKPRTGRNTRAKRRYQIIEETIEPIFDELLMKDLEEWKPEKPKKKEKPQGGAAGGEEGESEDFNFNPFADEYEDFEDNNPDQIGDKDIEEFSDKEAEGKNAKKAVNKGADKAKEEELENKAKKAQEELDRIWAEKNAVKPEVLKEFREIEAQIAPYLDELSRLWRDIVMGSSKGRDVSRAGYFKTGELSIPRVIAEWSNVEKREFEKVRAMERVVSTDKLIEKPELIRVRLVCDLSGSMFQKRDGAKDTVKIPTLKKAIVLVLASLKEFNTYLAMNRSITKSKLEVDTEVWVFGSTALKIKPLRSDSTQLDDQVDIVNTFGYLNQHLGQTYDDKALRKIQESITPADAEKIASEKIMEIVFEITDGQPNEPDKTKQKIGELEGIGVAIRGFQIGVTSAEEKNYFNYVWNSEAEKKGEVVGAEIGNLIPAITIALKKYLRGVRL